MADDITLTVRVRDMTRGDFNQIRQRMRGMDGDVRRLAQTNNGAAQSADRFSRSIRGVQGRLSQLQRTGNLARSEMDHMRRSMGLLGRELRQAAQNGELADDDFRALSQQLQRTRLDFDHLDNEIRRHNAVSQRRHRDEMARQREAARRAREERRRQEADGRAIIAIQRRAAQAQTAERRRQEADARAIMAIRRRAEQQAREERRRQEAHARADAAQRRDHMRRLRAQGAAIREEARRNQQAQREELRAQMAAARRDMAERRHQIRMVRAHGAALREEAARTQRAEAERARAARAAAQQQQRDLIRLAGLGGRDAARPANRRQRRARADDQGLTLRFRALGEDDMNRMSRGFTNLTRTMSGITGSSDRARRSVRALGGDLRTMTRALQDAQNAGSLSRREFNALSRGLQMTVRDARMLRSSGDLTRSAFRDMRREVSGMRAQLRLLGNEGSVFDRLADRTLILRRGMRETRTSAGHVHRALSRMGEGGLGGLQLFMRGLGHMSDGVGRLRERIMSASHGMKIFLAVLALLGPLAPAIGALVTTALGGAFVALGAFALRGEKDVRNAFKHMKSSVAVSVRGAAQPLRAGLVVAMHEVAEATQEMGNALSQAFAASAPLVSDLAGAFTDLASGAMPGVVESLREMGPVIDGFREAMGSIGEGLGQMFAAMTSEGGAQGLQDTWRILGDGIKDVLINIGEFINAMSQSETATTLLSTAFGVLSSILVIIEGVFAAVDAVLGPLIEKMGELGITTGLVGLLAKGLESLGVSAVDVESNTSAFTESLKGTASAQNDAAVKTLSHAEALKQLNEQIKEHNNNNLDRFQAEAGLNQALIDAKRNAENYGSVVKINNGIFDTTHENTNKVAQDFYKLAESTQRAVDAAIKADQPLKEQNRLWKEGESSIRALGKAYNIPKAELDAYIDLVLKTPKSAKTDLELEAEAAKQKAIDYLKKLDKADGFVAKAKAALEAQAAVREAGRIAMLLNGLNGRVTRSKHIHTTIMTEVMRRVEENASPRFTANGGVLRNFANGGRENHVAQIAPAGSWRVWAEDETGGESYIPLSPAKRPRSRRIAEETIGILGGRVEWFAKGGVRSEARQAIRPIKDATSGTTEKNLLRLMNQIIKGSIKMATALKSVTSALDKAKSKLSSLRTEASSLSSSVKSRTMTPITEGVDAGKPVSVATLMGRMRVGRDKATAFADALKRLRKRGLSKGLLRQVAEAGVDGGGLETAGALLRASGSELKSINSFYGQMSAAGSSAGKTTADAIFGKQIKAQEKLVKALTDLSSELKKATAKSKKKKATGGIIGAATGGLRGGLVEVGEQGPELVRLPYGSSVYSNPDSRRIAGSSGSGGDGVFVFPIMIGGKVLDEVILDSNRRTVRTRGGNVQAVFGPTRR